MIRTLLILLALCLLGWGVSSAIQAEAPATAPTAALHSGDFSAIHEHVGASVVPYTLPDCSASAEARSLFDARGVDHVELDVGASADARDEARALGATGVPRALLGDVGIEGFDRAQLIALLDERQATLARFGRHPSD